MRGTAIISKIVIWPQQPAERIDAIRKAAGRYEVVAPRDEAETRAVAPDAEGWIGLLNPDLLKAAKKLRWLQSPTISLESVVFPELIASEITLTNMRNIYNDHIANHVLALFLSLCRDLPRLMRRQLERDWVPQAITHDPAAMRVLIVGLGGIGAEVARRLKVLGPTLIGIDPKLPSPPEGINELYKPDVLPDQLSRADAVIICAPLTPQTMGLFDESMFLRMKRDALFINIGRGRIVKLSALERALGEGWIAGAGLDVFETEPLPASSPLWRMDNVIITPHTAGFGPHTEERRLAIVLENLRRFVAGQPLATVADKSRWY